MITPFIGNSARLAGLVGAANSLPSGKVPLSWTYGVVAFERAPLPSLIDL